MAKIIPNDFKPVARVLIENTKTELHDIEQKLTATGSRILDSTGTYYPKQYESIETYINANGQILDQFGHVLITEEQRRKYAAEQIARDSKPNEITVHFTVKEYKDGTIQVKVHKQPTSKTISKTERDGGYNEEGKDPELVLKDREHELKRRQNRTKTEVYDLARCNRFTHFVTLTTNRKNFVDRKDLKGCYKKIAKWLNHFKRYDSEFKYICIPEPHKNKAWHFHLLVYFSKPSETLKRATNAKNGKPLTDEHGREVYNIIQYGLGWSTAIPLDGSPKIASYMTKYITKELYGFAKNEKIIRTSKGLNKPTETKTERLWFEIPEELEPIWSTEFSDGYEWNFYDDLPF